jgi:hypothetical protein
MLQDRRKRESKEWACIERACIEHVWGQSISGSWYLVIIRGVQRDKHCNILESTRSAQETRTELSVIGPSGIATLTYLWLENMELRAAQAT